VIIWFRLFCGFVFIVGRFVTFGFVRCLGFVICFVGLHGLRVCFGGFLCFVLCDFGIWWLVLDVLHCAVLLCG